MNNKPNRLSQAIRGALGLALAALLLGLPSAGGAAGQKQVTTSLMVPLSGSVFVNTGTQAETVDLSGSLHLVVEADLTDQLTPTPHQFASTRIWPG